MTSADDKRMIEGVRNGDAEAFGRLLEKHSDRVFGLVVRVVGNREDAEELTQDIFMKVLHALPGYRGESAFSTWLYRIAYNCAVSKVRKRRLRFSSDETVWERLSGEVPEEEFPDREERLQALEAALRRLPPEEALLVLMFYREEKSVEELSEITGLSEANVKVRLHRIRKKLRVLMLAGEK